MSDTTYTWNRKPTNSYMFQLLIVPSSDCTRY